MPAQMPLLSQARRETAGKKGAASSSINDYWTESFQLFLDHSLTEG